MLDQRHNSKNMITVTLDSETPGQSDLNHRITFQQAKPLHHHITRNILSAYSQPVLLLLLPPPCLVHTVAGRHPY